MFSKLLLYRFRFPCQYVAPEPEQLGSNLDETFLLPDINQMEQTIGKHRFACNFRIGWNETGLLFSLHVSGKRQSLWCRTSQPDESDGIQICLDTRDVKDVHRASRFCHRLLFMPVGSGRYQSQPLAVWLPIHRAKEHPRPIELAQIKMKSDILPEGYRLHVFIPGKVLTGFAPAEFPSIGFHFSVMDREHGSYYFLAAPPLPHDQDPSLWGTLSLALPQ